MTLKTAQQLAQEVIEGHPIETAHEILMLGKCMRRDALIRHVRRALVVHPEAKKAFEDYLGAAFRAESASKESSCPSSKN